MDYSTYIFSSPKVLFGKPCVKGTRIPVELILEKLAYGETIPYLLQAYPKLTESAIYACLMYASLSLKHEHIYSVSA